MTETETTKGTVAKIQAWKTNKGYFLNLSGDDNDYYAFGKNYPGEGDAVELVVTEGTGSFGDKLCITKWSKLKQEKTKEAQEKQDEEESEFKEAHTIYKTQADVQRMIVEQSCLKTAGYIVSKIWPKQEDPDWREIAEAALTMKDIFAADIIAEGEARE